MSPRHLPRLAVAILLAAAAALGHAPADAAAGPPPADVDAIDKASLPKDLVVVTDGSGHFLATSLTDRDRIFYGDAKLLHEQSAISSGASPGDGDYSWRLWAPQSPDHADVALDDGKAWTVTCGGRTTPMHALDERETRAAIERSSFKKAPWKRQSVLLARDRGGKYYFVDRLRDEHGGKGLRLFVGKKGRLKEARLVDALADSAGLLLETRSGDLEVDFEKATARWGKGKKKGPLVFLPVQDNRLLIYGELGVYRQRLGVPCDDL